LPEPGAEARAHSERLVAKLIEEMERQGGAIPFDRYMELALYAPGLGYYTAGARKFGPSGDFVTAPEISPVFGRCLARQVQQVLEQIGGGDLLEFGAGSGRLAVDLLRELESLDALPGHYLILELSPDLRQRQQETLQEQLPHLVERVEWLDALPACGFRGVVVANELFDAMPVHRFRMEAEGLREQFVSWNGERFENSWRPPQSPGLQEAVQQLGIPLPEGFESEINLRLEPWMASVGALLEAGAALFIDYGYSRADFYHPQRSAGTLMCHYRHRAHPDPLVYPGLQDITAHVDFTALAQAAQAAGLAVGGYSTQAFFLMGCGLDRIMSAADPANSANYMDLAQGVKRLTLPTEMGERFKVLALTRGVPGPLIGFSMRDQRERL
jgi:SAM-dependent MidA family methyltransferase